MKLKLQKGIDPNTGETIWVMLDASADYQIVEPIQQYLTFLCGSKSPNTVESYGYDLKAWWEFLEHKQLDWQQVQIDDLEDFAYWLLVGDISNVVSIQPISAKRSQSSINRAITTIRTFYEYHVAIQTVDLKRVDRFLMPGVRKTSLLTGIAKTKPIGQKLVKYKQAKQFPGCLSALAVETLVEACSRLRDKLIILMLNHTGMRKGELLGLCHRDIGEFNDYSISIVQRVNPNGARAKGVCRVIPVPKEVLQLYDEYLIHEYPEVSKEYVFVNIWEGKVGVPMNPRVLNIMFRRLSQKTGINVYPHLFRHTYATRLLKENYPVDRVKYLLGHVSVQTTLDIYSHIINSDILNQVVEKEKEDNEF